MKKILIGIFIGVALTLGAIYATIAIADPGDRPVERIINSAWNSTTNVLRVVIV